MVMRLLAIFLPALAASSVATQAKAAQLIYVAKESRTLYDRDLYLYELLQAALDAAKFAAKIEHVKVHPHQQRTVMPLSRGKVDLHWSMTSPVREQIAIAIKVPLYGGRIGKRVLMVHQDIYPAIKNVRSVEDLKRFTAVQGHDWPDTKILSYNGLKVRSIADYQVMFNLIVNKKADYFPRSVIEAHSELIAQVQSQLMIVPDFHLSYPSAFYFFVNKEKKELAQGLRDGLIKMMATNELQA